MGKVREDRGHHEVGERSEDEANHREQQDGQGVDCIVAGEDLPDDLNIEGWLDNSHGSKQIDRQGKVDEGEYESLAGDETEGEGVSTPAHGDVRHPHRVDQAEVQHLQH